MMQTFWAEHGFYLWALTTALAVIALAWLGYNSFARAEVEPTEGEVEAGEEMEALVAQVQELSEGAPLMRATLGRTLQFFGLERYLEADGAAAFVLAVVNARGDGFILTSTAPGGLTAKPLFSWAGQSKAPFSAAEQAAVDQARAQREKAA